MAKFPNSISKSILSLSHLRLHFSSINHRKHTPLPSKSMSWSCKKCTFLNSPSQKSSCKLCSSSIVSSSPPPSSSSLAPKWVCKACTFLNSYQNSKCEVYETIAFALSLSSLEDLNDTDPLVCSVFLPLQRCKKRARDDPVEDGDLDCVELSRFRGLKALSKDKGVVDVGE